ncbi:hypothetical protein AAG570_011943 [Ranatra chinensis]|uniref:Neurotransmitter-gated ion-channel transmembrane domain-containing protein n=1 Tax=Ranatra chinensis TaxID=642074 RepID=A0ABD0YVU3_9HEMI
MDYYVPSILLVILSWMSFWLAADQVPPRVLLGTSTMLTFIQLAWSDSSLPKVSQLKANDVWAVGCTTFIFLSLSEFAFVNTIDRRDKEHKVELKKPTSKYILRSTLSSKPPRMRLRRSSSCPSSPEIRRHFAKNMKAALKEIQEKEELKPNDLPIIPEKRSNSGDNTSANKNTGGHVMTPQEIAIWIDNKSRLMFPLGFLVFNICYWSFLWI